MFKCNHSVVLLAAAVLALPAMAETIAEPAVTESGAAVAYDHEADRLPTRQRDSSVGGTLSGWAASGQEQAGKVWNTVTGESLKDAVVPGSHTSAWLTLQRAGTAASANPQAASAVQREKAADRFLKTYDFPIKESFYGDSFKSGSN
jgi:hypothetical protein